GSQPPRRLPACPTTATVALQINRDYLVQLDRRSRCFDPLSGLLPLRLRRTHQELDVARFGAFRQSYAHLLWADGDNLAERSLHHHWIGEVHQVSCYGGL